MNPAGTLTKATRQDNRRSLVRLSTVAVLMFGFGYALVPFYERICAALGVNSLVERGSVPATSKIDLGRTVTIEFDANAHDLPWRFRPLVRHLEFHPGELVHVEYEIVNTGSTPVTGQAIASYGPIDASRYFHKLECFCFSKQTLEAGETRRMPVTFVIDSALPADVKTITLSYTFFELAGTSGRT